MSTETTVSALSTSNIAAHKMSAFIFHFLLVIFIVALTSSELCANRTKFYTAAIYEHAMDFRANSVTSRTEALSSMQSNLDIFEEQVIKAKSKVK